MARGRITKRAVDALACPADKDREFLWDDALTGFGVMALASGKKTYVAQYRQARVIYVCILAISFMGSSKGGSVEQIVFKSLGQWVCRAHGYYSLEVDPTGEARTVAEKFSHETVNISVEQELSVDFELSDHLGFPPYYRGIDDEMGSKLRVTVTGGGDLFDTKAEGEKARGEPRFGKPLEHDWEKKKDSLNNLRATFNNGFFASKFMLLELENNTETWVFSLTSQSVTTARTANEVHIWRGTNIGPSTDVYFITGECLRD